MSLRVDQSAIKTKAVPTTRVPNCRSKSEVIVPARNIKMIGVWKTSPKARYIFSMKSSVWATAGMNFAPGGFWLISHLIPMGSAK